MDRMKTWEIVFAVQRDPDPNYRYWVSCTSIDAARAIVLRDYGDCEYRLVQVDSERDI